MTPEEIADRIIISIRMGCVHGVATMVVRHCQNAAVAARLAGAGPDVLSWIYWASPWGSTMNRVANNAPLALSRRKVNEIEYAREEAMKELKGTHS